MIAACLSGKQPYIVDSTNSTKAERARYVGPAKAAGFRVIGIEFVIPVSLAMQRNGQREGKRRVPDKAIYITVAKREPLVSEEGFDELWVATVTTEGIQIKEKISAL